MQRSIVHRTATIATTKRVIGRETCSSAAVFANPVRFRGEMDVIGRTIYRVFRNLWELIVRLKIMKKKSYKYMSYLSSFVRYNEFSVLITFTKDACH